MPDVSATDAAIGGGSFAAAWAVLRWLGGGLRWLAGFVTGRQDKREAELNAREARLDEQDSERMRALREEVDALKAWQHDMTAQRERDHRKMDRVAMLCRLFIEEIEQINPGSSLAAQGRALLMRDFPELFVLAPTPPDMMASIARLD